MSASPSAPFVADSTFTSIPFAKSSAVNSGFATSSTTILPATKLVPSGIVSFIIAFPSAYPLLYTVIVYSISSPTTTADLFDVFSDVIIGSWYSVSVSGVSLSFTVATFLIVSPLFKLPTVTSKLTVVVPFASTSTFIPSANCSAVYSVASLFTFILPSTKVVPSGIVSATIAFPSTSPVFVTVIVYVIVSPCFTSVPVTDVFPFTVAVFVALIIGVCVSGFSSSPVSSPFTVALFIIAPLAFSFTTTVNVTVAVSPALSSTEIPCVNSAVVYALSELLTVTIAFSLKCVPSGALS